MTQRCTNLITSTVIAEASLNALLLGDSGNQPPMMAFGCVKGKLEYEMLESKRFVEKHKLNDFKFNAHFPVNTVSIMRGLHDKQDGNGVLRLVLLANRRLLR